MKKLNYQGFWKSEGALAHRETQPHAPLELPSARALVSAAAKSTAAGPGGLRGRRRHRLGRLRARRAWDRCGQCRSCPAATPAGDGGGGALRGAHLGSTSGHMHAGGCLCACACAQGCACVHTSARGTSSRGHTDPAPGSPASREKRRLLLSDRGLRPPASGQSGFGRGVRACPAGGAVAARSPRVPWGRSPRTFSGTRRMAGGRGRPPRLRRQLAGPAGAPCGAGGFEHLRG